MCSYPHRSRSYSYNPARYAALHAWRLLLFLLLACLTRQVRGQTNLAGESGKGPVRGVVLNRATHEPVGRALVFSPDNRFATFTDDQGHFALALPDATGTTPPPGVNETISIAGADYVGASFANFPTMLMARKPGFLNMERSPWPWDRMFLVEGKDVTITLVPEARIVGRVVLPTSNASDRIRVQLYRRQVFRGRARWNFVSSATARSNGEFRFAELEAGTYKLLTGELMDRDPLTADPRGPMYGYPPSYFPNALNFQSASEISLTPGMTFQAQLSPLRQAYYPVRIPVTNAGGEAGLEVSVAVQGSRGPGFELGYNPRNQRIEGSLPNGTYVVEASSQGENAATGSAALTVKDASAEASPMTLAPTGSVHIEAKLEFKSDSETVERNESSNEFMFPGQPTAQGRGENFNVVLEPADEFLQLDVSNRTSSVLQQGDSMIFAQVSPGRYWVRVDASRGFAASVTSGTVDLLRRPLTVAPGSNLRVEVRLRDDGAELFGSIPVESAPEVQNVKAPAERHADSSYANRMGGFIYCIPLPDSAGQFKTGRVGQDGTFSLRQVPPGSYRVLAFDRLQIDLEYTNNEAMRAYEGKGLIVRLSARQKEQITVPLLSTNE
jgi:hypothetical protein